MAPTDANAQALAMRMGEHGRGRAQNGSSDKKKPATP
jgi:hypothetical protein